MGTLEKFSGKVVFIDTAPLVYHIEKIEKYRSVLRSFFGELDHGNFRAVTSIVTFMEVLVKPYRDGLYDLTSAFEKCGSLSGFVP